MTKLIFVRHSESIKNVEKILDWTNEKKYKLTEKWQKQAQDLKEFLKNENVDVIFSSYFERAIDTIKPFSIESWIEIIIDERIRETHHWMFEWTIWDNEEYQKSKKKFKENPNSKLWETWDSKNEILTRFKEFVEEKVENHKWKTIVIISHWYPLSIILNELDNTKDYFSKEFKPDNAKPIIISL